MRLTRFLFAVALAAFAIAAVLFAWLYLPSLHRQSTHEYSASQLLLATGEGLPEPWTSRLDFPRRIPFGRRGILRLKFSPQPSAPAPDSAADFYSRYGVMIQARAEIPSAGTAPSGLATRVLEPRRPVEFVWQITPRSEGTLDGRVWLYIRFVPKDGGPTVEHPLSVQLVSIRSSTLFGKTADQLQEMALIASAVGMVLALPHLLLRSRRRREPAPAGSTPSDQNPAP